MTDNPTLNAMAADITRMEAIVSEQRALIQRLLTDRDRHVRALGAASLHINNIGHAIAEMAKVTNEAGKGYEKAEEPKPDPEIVEKLSAASKPLKAFRRHFSPKEDGSAA